MRILALDTTSLRGSVALQEDRQLLGLVYLATTQDHSTTLLRSIDFLLTSAALSIEQIDGFAVASGPGSFSGIRIGLATAKSLAQTRNKPIIAVSALQALAFRFRFFPSLLCPMIDAQRRQIYTALYRPLGDDVEEIRAPAAAAPRDWLATLPDAAIAFVGDGAVRYQALVNDAGRPPWRVPAVTPYLAEAIAQIGQRLIGLGQGVSAGAIEGLYLRPSDAEIAKAARRSPSTP